MGNELSVVGAIINVVDISRELKEIAPLAGRKRGRMLTSFHCQNTGPQSGEVVVKAFVRNYDDKEQSDALNRHIVTLQAMESSVRETVRRAALRSHGLRTSEQVLQSVIDALKRPSGRAAATTTAQDSAVLASSAPAHKSAWPSPRQVAKLVSVGSTNAPPASTPRSGGAAAAASLTAAEPPYLTALAHTTPSVTRLSNVLFYSDCKLTDRVIYVQRGYVQYSLTERLHQRPYLNACQRLFLAYQVLKGVEEMHMRFGVPHGDVKAQNVMITSTGWAYLVDPAPYKPAFLEAKNPLTFELYYDNTETRDCCIAPERFVEGPNPSSSEAASSANPSSVGATGGITQNHEIFSAGCIVAQLLCDRAIFKLTNVLDLRAAKSVDAARELLRERLETALVPPRYHALIAWLLIGKDMDSAAEQMAASAAALTAGCPPAASSSAADTPPSADALAPAPAVRRPSSSAPQPPTNLESASQEDSPVILPDPGSMMSKRLKSPAVEGSDNRAEDTNTASTASGDSANSWLLSTDTSTGSGGATRVASTVTTTAAAAMPPVVKAPMWRRPTVPEIQARYAQSDLMPAYFPFLHRNVLASLLPLPPEIQVQYLWSRYDDCLRTAERCFVDIDFARTMSLEKDSFADLTSSTMTAGGGSPSPAGSAALPEEVRMSIRRDVTDILAPVLTHTIRKLQTDEAHQKAALLMAHMASFASTSVRQEVLLPSLMLLMRRPADTTSALTRAIAIRSMSSLVSKLGTLPESDATVFEDFILTGFYACIRAASAAATTAGASGGILIPSSSSSSAPIWLAAAAQALGPIVATAVQHMDQRASYRASQVVEALSKAAATSWYGDSSGAGDGSGGVTPTVSSPTSPTVVAASSHVTLSYSSHRRTVLLEAWDVLRPWLSNDCSAVVIAALDSLCILARNMDPETCLDTVVPFLMTLLSRRAVEIRRKTTEACVEVCSTLNKPVRGSTMSARFLLDDALDGRDVRNTVAALQGIKRLLAEEALLPVDFLELGRRAAQLLRHPSQPVQLAAIEFLQALCKVGGEASEAPPLQFRAAQDELSAESVLVALQPVLSAVLSDHTSVHDLSLATLPFQLRSSTVASDAVGGGRSNGATLLAPSFTRTRVPPCSHDLSHWPISAATQPQAVAAATPSAASPHYFAGHIAPTGATLIASLNSYAAKQSSAAGSAPGKAATTGPGSAVIPPRGVPTLYVCPGVEVPDTLVFTATGAVSPPQALVATAPQAFNFAHFSPDARQRKRLLHRQPKDSSRIDVTGTPSGVGSGGGGGTVGGNGPSAATPPPMLRPSGTLLAMVPRAHDEGTVIQALSASQHFLLTACTGNAVKLWDTSDAFTPKSVIRFQGKRSGGLSALPESSAAIVVFAAFTNPHDAGAPALLGSSDGTVRLYDPYQSQVVRETRLGSGSSGGLTSVCTDGARLAFVGSCRAGIFALDYRMPCLKEVWSTALSARTGPVSSLLIADEPFGLLCGTLKGSVTLFDLRFRAPVYQYDVPGRSPCVYAMARVTGSNTESFGGATKASGGGTIPGPSVALATSVNDVTRLSLSGSAETLTMKPAVQGTVRAMLSINGGSQLVTGGVDRTLRVWDLANPEQSRTLVPLGSQADASPVYNYNKGALTVAESCDVGSTSLRPTDHAGGQHVPLSAPTRQPHAEDAITHLCTVQEPGGGQQCLVSASRDGVIRLWRNLPGR